MGEQDVENMGVMLGIDPYAHDTHVGGISSNYGVRNSVQTQGGSTGISLGTMVFDPENGELKFFNPGECGHYLHRETGELASLSKWGVGDFDPTWERADAIVLATG